MQYTPMERYKRVELLSSAWRAVVLPLHQYRIYPSFQIASSFIKNLHNFIAARREGFILATFYTVTVCYARGHGCVRMDSHHRPSGYEPDELTTAPLRII